MKRKVGLGFIVVRGDIGRHTLIDRVDSLNARPAVGIIRNPSPTSATAAGRIYHALFMAGGLPRMSGHGLPDAEAPGAEGSPLVQKGSWIQWSWSLMLLGTQQRSRTPFSAVLLYVAGVSLSAGLAAPTRTENLQIVL